jgi:hypothetical protein
MCGTQYGAGTCRFVSRGLVNSLHADLKDKSCTYAILSDPEGIKAEHWYFVFPNLSINGSTGVGFKLFHGAVVSWDGRLLRHCTSAPEAEGPLPLYGIAFCCLNN